MNAARITSGSATKVQVCALRYLPSADTEPREGSVILYAVKAPSQLRLYLHRGFKHLVSERDRAYFEELFQDFRGRCREYPEELFAQLSNLSVGPLITDSIYSEDTSQPMLCPDFDFCNDSDEDCLCEAL